MLKVYSFPLINNLIIVIYVLLITMITITLSEETKSSGVIVQPYQEYYIEHVVTEKDAAKSYKESINRLLNGKLVIIMYIFYFVKNNQQQKGLKFFFCGTFRLANLL